VGFILGDFRTKRPVALPLSNVSKLFLFAASDFGDHFKYGAYQALMSGNVLNVRLDDAGLWVHFLSWVSFCNPFTILQSIYNFAIHLQFCNPFTILQSIYNFAIHLQFCNPFTILQSIYNFAIHLQFCNTFAFQNLFTILQYIFILPSIYVQF
jgi:hypothetical protein